MTERIKLTFLGTGSAVPTARRNHQAVLLKYKDENILFDCGEGTQRQFRKAKLNPCKVTKIFISHWHGDHILGLAGLLETMALNGYNGVLEIFGPKGSKKKYSELVLPHLGFYMRISKDEGFIFDVRVKEVREGKVIDSEEFEIFSTRTEHNPEGLAYSFVIKEKNRIDKEKLKKLKIPNGPLVGQISKGKIIEFSGKKVDGSKLLYREPSRKVTIISDTRYINSLIEFSKNSDVLISEATYLKDEEEMANKHFHLTSTQAATIAERSGSKLLYLVHLSQKYDMIPKVVLKEAREIFKNTKVVEDLDRIEL